MPSVRKAMIFEVITETFANWETILQINQQDRSAIATEQSRHRKRLAKRISTCSPAGEVSSSQLLLFPIKRTATGEQKFPKRKIKSFYRIARDPTILGQVEALDLGSLNQVCMYCKALFFEGEQQNCCRSGDIAKALLPKLYEAENELPQLFKDLFDGVHQHSTVFKENIRKLNSVFSFTSLGVSRQLGRSQAIQANSTLGNFD